SIVVTVWLFLHVICLYIVGYKIYYEASIYWDYIPSSYFHIKEWLNTQSNPFHKELIDKLPNMSLIMEYLTHFFEQTNLSHLLNMLDGSFTIILSFFVTFQNIAFSFIVFVLALYMIAIDYKRITNSLQKLVPSKLSKLLRDVYKEFWRTLLRLSIA